VTAGCAVALLSVEGRGAEGIKRLLRTNRPIVGSESEQFASTRADAHFDAHPSRTAPFGATAAAHDDQKTGAERPDRRPALSCRWRFWTGEEVRDELLDAPADNSVEQGESDLQPSILPAPKKLSTPVVGGRGVYRHHRHAFGADSAGYVLEHDVDGIIPPLGPSNDGRLIRINPSGTQTVIATPGLIKPGGITVGPDGALYATHRSIFAGSGEVLRIVP